MKLELRSKGVRLTAGLRGFVERKLRSAMGRFDHRVERVRVQLTDINGPKGGEDIRCHIEASLGRAGAITIKETRSDAYAAVAHAGERAGRRLSRHLARIHANRRGR